MKDLFLIIATILTVCAVIPYVIDILKGKSKPNLVSWITWTLLTGIATAAELSAGEFVAAIFTGSATLATVAILVTGLMKKSYVRYTRFDVICQLGTIVGIFLWQFFSNPALALVANIAIDFVGALPTVRHSYQKPQEETLVTYVVSFVGAISAVLALQTYNWVSLPYAIYLIFINGLISVVILYARNRQS